VRSKVRRAVLLFALVAGWVMSPANICQATIFPFEIFTTNSPYADDPGWNLYVDVWNGEGVVNFTFYNASTIQSSIARVYFDDGSLLGLDALTNGPGTQFNTAVSPGDLPGGQNLVPPFTADREFTIGSGNPPPWKGVNNNLGEWVSVRFNLINGGTLDDVIGELSTGTLRIGMHLIDLPEGYSESAIFVIPEPATIMLLSLGTLVLLRKRRA